MDEEIKIGDYFIWLDNYHHTGTIVIVEREISNAVYLNLISIKNPKIIWTYTNIENFIKTKQLIRATRAAKALYAT